MPSTASICAGRRDEELAATGASSRDKSNVSTRVGSMSGQLEEIRTEVFAELPAEFRKSGSPSPWLVAQLRGRDLHSLLEGPTFDRQGNLWVVDTAYGRIFRVTPAGQ